LTQYIPLPDARKVTGRGLVGCVESARAPKTEDLQLSVDDYSRRALDLVAAWSLWRVAAAIL
jgi:hypothetical protein